MATLALDAPPGSATAAKQADGEQAATREIPVDRRTAIAGFGLWIYLLSDGILFAALFAAYGVLSTQTAGGPTPTNLFDLPYVLLETGCLLTSSFACGIAMVETGRQRRAPALAWFGLTFALGLAFLGLEISEFAKLVGENAGPDRSAFLTSFFALVGTHGLHVFTGLFWLAALAAQLIVKGPTAPVRRRLLLFSIFWHVLDLIWIGVFSVVYLMGAR